MEGAWGDEGFFTGDCQHSTFICPAFHTVPALLPLYIVNMPLEHSGIPIGRISLCMLFIYLFIYSYIYAAPARFASHSSWVHNGRLVYGILV